MTFDGMGCLLRLVVQRFHGFSELPAANMPYTDQLRRRKNSGASSRCSSRSSVRDSDRWTLLPRPVRKYPKFCVFLVALACYVQSLNGDFVFDDVEAIVQNPDVIATHPVWRTFTNDYWGASLQSKASHKSYRPLTVLSFRMNFLVHGLSSPGYHAVNVALHAIAAILVHELCRRCLEKAGLEDATMESVVAALIFAVHPIHTEAVANIVGRAELLGAVFFLGAVLTYIVLLEEDKYLPRRFPLVALLTAASLLSKEQGITALGICAAYDVVLHCHFDPRSLAAYAWQFVQDARNNNKHRSSYGTSVSRLMQRIALLCIWGVVLFIARLALMGFQVPLFTAADNPASFLNDAVLRFMNYNYLYSINLWLLCCPVWLCFDWSMGCVPLIMSLCDPRLISVLAFWSLAFLVAWMCWCDKNASRRRLLCFAILLLIVPFMPSSNLFFRVGFVVAERVLYLPSIGYCLLSALALTEACQVAREHREIIKVGMYGLVITFLVRSIHRTTDWSTEERLFVSGTRVCPLNAKAHYNLGKVWADRGYRSVAEMEYAEALRLHPTYDQAMNNLANVLKDKGQFQDAEQLLKRAVQLKPDFAIAWMNLGIVQTALKKYGDAERSYHWALHHRRNYADCLYNLGNLYLEQDRRHEALACWQNATIVNRKHVKAWINMMILADENADYERCAMIGREALQHVHAEPALHFTLASCLGKAGQFSSAENQFLLAIHLQPGNAKYYANLGVLYHRWGKHKAAEQAYLKALQNEPDMDAARLNLEKLKRTTGQ